MWNRLLVFLGLRCDCRAARLRVKNNPDIEYYSDGHWTVSTNLFCINCGTKHVMKFSTWTDPRKQTLVSASKQGERSK